MRPTPTATKSAHVVEGFTPCLECGGAVSAIVGVREGPWRRHPSCSGSQRWDRVAAAAATLGLGVIELDVARLAGDVPRFREVHIEPVWSDADRKRKRGPWRHIDKKELRRAIEAARVKLAEASIPRPCELGKCAWCGTDAALDWFADGHRWSDGSEAPLCAGCHEVYLRRGSPSPLFFEDQRLALVEAITDVPPSLGEMDVPGVLAYAEADDQGDGTAWSHLPSAAVEALRWDRWMRFGGKHAPTGKKEEARRRARQADLERAARSADAEAEHQRDADLFGFMRMVDGNA